MNRTPLLALVPNGLSLVRVGLGLAFPLLSSELRPWAVALAAASDALDGPAARWLRAESDAGRLLDPAADKVFVLMLAGTLLADGAIHPLWAAGVVARDLTVLGAAVTFAARRRWADFRGMRPSRLGKAATAAQYAVLVAAVVWGAAPAWLLAGTTALSVAAGVGYVVTFERPP